MAISITNRAQERIKEIIAAQYATDAPTKNSLDPNQIFLRIGVRGGGCSGLNYLLELDIQKGPHDKEFAKGPDEKGDEREWGFRVVVEPKSYLYLNGITLDFVVDGLVEGFTFINPNAKSSCGCGTSFSA